MALTQLTQKIEPYDTVVKVESTEDFPDSGVLRIGGPNGEGLAYQNKTDTQFNLARYAVKAHEEGEEVSTDGKYTCFAEMICPYCGGPVQVEYPVSPYGLARGYCTNCAAWKILTDSKGYYCSPPMGTG